MKKKKKSTYFARAVPWQAQKSVDIILTAPAVSVLDMISLLGSSEAKNAERGEANRPAPPPRVVRMVPLEALPEAPPPSVFSRVFPLYCTIGALRFHDDCRYFLNLSSFFSRNAGCSTGGIKSVVTLCVGSTGVVSRIDTEK